MADDAADGVRAVDVVLRLGAIMLGAGSPTDDVERGMRTAAASLGLTRRTAAVSFGIWATNDAVWVRAPEQFLTRIDPTTNEVVEVIDGPVGAGDVTVAFGSVWATSGHALTVYRFEP